MKGVGIDGSSLPASRLTGELASTYLADGSWEKRSLCSYFREAATTHSGKIAAVNYDGQTGRKGTSVTYAEYRDLVERLACGLQALGVSAGDAVCVFLPNRLEFGAVIYSIMELGATYSGIPISYGSREASFILRRTKAKVLIVPSEYRGRNFIELARQLRTEVSNLKTIVVMGKGVPEGEGWVPFDDLTSSEGPTPTSMDDPGLLTHLGFTSGTTAEPKAVMNTHYTLGAVMRRWTEHIGEEMLGESTINLIASPIGHHTGFLWGVLLSSYLGGTSIYLDGWNASAAGEVIKMEEVTLMLGAPTFLQDLIRAPSVTSKTYPSLRMISIPGAPIPRALVSQARELLGCYICPAWGMTEYGIGISGSPNLPLTRVEETDGVPIKGCDVRVVRSSDNEEAKGEEEGDLEVKGAGLFLGYYDRPDFTQESIRDGWFKTGDRAVRHSDGFISLRGRTKDIVIRGGENIPIIEVENLLYRHPHVLDASIIGIPDERLGERACAVLVAKPGHILELSDINDFLLAQGLSKHFLPERIELVDALPRTASGKLRKVELREQFSSGPGTER